LLQYPRVPDQALEIGGVELGKNGVEEFPPVFADARDERDIVRRDDHEGIVADVFGKARIRQVVQVKLLAPGLAQDADRFFITAIDTEPSFQPESFMPFLGYQGILPRKIAFGEAEIVDGIQQVGLANAVTPADTHDPFIETEFPRKIVLELN
jgi:hypothetical protein